MAKENEKEADDDSRTPRRSGEECIGTARAISSVCDKQWRRPHILEIEIGRVDGSTIGGYR